MFHQRPEWFPKSWSFPGDRIQYNFGHTAASNVEGSPTFRGLTPPPSSGCYWWLGKAKVKQMMLWFYFGFTKPSVAPWRWKWSRSSKRSRTFTPLRGCVPEKILQHVFVPICDTNILSQIQSTHHNIQQNHTKDKSTNIQSEDSPSCSWSYPFLNDAHKNRFKHPWYKCGWTHRRM